jgi:hypothetical protein
LDSAPRYCWFPRRFVVMPDHIHLIAHQGYEAVRLGQWIKALRAVAGGLERRADADRRVGEPGLQDDGLKNRPVGAPGLQPEVPVGRVPTPGGGVAPPPGVDVATPPARGIDHPYTRIKRSWRWQEGFHDHKLRTPEGEQRKWEYVCLNPVRYRLVARPEQWPFGGEIFYDPSEGVRLERGTPPLLEMGLLIEETPGRGTRPTR